MFVGLFYLPVLPTGAFLAFFHCFFSCIADRVGLIYQWKKLPPAGAGTLFKVLTTHVGFAILTHLYMAMVFFSGWSYDSTCAIDPNSICDAVRCDASNSLWYNCNKHQLGALMTTLPYMSDAQVYTVTLYKVSFVVLITVGLFVSVWASRKTIRGLFVSTATHEGVHDNGRAWSTISSIHLYIPSFDLPRLDFPLVACDHSKFSSSHVSWMCKLDDYSLFKDAQEDVASKKLQNRTLFDSCTQYIEDATMVAIVKKESWRRIGKKAKNKLII
jgi:hypothetical protein